METSLSSKKQVTPQPGALEAPPSTPPERLTHGDRAPSNDGTRTMRRRSPRHPACSRLAPTFSALCVGVALAACGGRSDLEGEVASVPVAAAGDAGDEGAACPVGGPTAYLWTADAALYTFDPATLQTTLLGVVSCPSDQPPWTMTVSGSGFGYMIYDDWNIYRVDLATLACTPTPYVPGQLGFTGEEGVAVAREDGVERFFVFGDGTVPTLAVSDFTSFVLSEVGPATPDPDAFPVAVQGDASGRLYALSQTGTFFELGSTPAEVSDLAQTTLGEPDNWAILRYGAGIYLFGQGGAVGLYDPVANQLVPLGSVNMSIIGASAAPCGP
jgi:hypothetical protein